MTYDEEPRFLRVIRAKEVGVTVFRYDRSPELPVETLARFAMNVGWDSSVYWYWRERMLMAMMRDVLRGKGF